MGVNYLNGAAATEAVGLRRDNGARDEQMEQIRELLLGDLRQCIARIESRLDAVEARLAALAGEVDTERKSTFEALARGVSDLGAQIREIAKP